MLNKNQYIISSNIKEAIEFSKSKENTKFIAGGTDLMVNYQQGNQELKYLIDITNIKELYGFTIQDSYLKIGALETLKSISLNNKISSEFPLLKNAALSVGSPLIRKTATIGGNILCENRCIFYNQSQWWRDSAGLCLKCDGDICIATKGKKACFSQLASDTAPALIAMDAKLEIYDNTGSKMVNIEDIYTGDGVSSINISDKELITSILLPINRNFKTSYHKLRQRESIDFTSATVAVAIDKQENIKVAISGLDPKAIVISSDKSNFNANELIKKAKKQARIVDNDIYSRKYRKNMMEVFLKRSFKELDLI